MTGASAARAAATAAEAEAAAAKTAHADAIRQLGEARREARDMRARYDAASTSDEDRRHWGNADGLGPNAAADPGVRAMLRRRGRYEAANNSYCRGLVRSLSYDLIGTGPRLQLSIPTASGGDDADSAKIVERNYAAWCRAVGFGRKLRLLEKCSARDGEGFALLDTNPRSADPVQLDLRLVEADQCHTPFEKIADPYTVDGVRFDEFWKPVEYYFLKYHPGEILQVTSLAIAWEFLTIPAEKVLHWFECDRPGQARGVPKITSALPLFAQLRRYTLATITAAEFAAMLAGVMESTLPADASGAPVIDKFELIELVRGALLTLPDGFKASQFKPEQPVTTYGDFKREILNETGRGTGAPLNVVSGNSSGYNFSSGRLDHLPYQRGLRIDRDDLRFIVLDPTFRAWYAEAVLVGRVPSGLPALADWTWSWNYDGFDSIDQNKDANADDTRIRNGTSTYKEIFAEYGQDASEQFQQMAREKAECEALGLPWPVLAPNVTLRGQPGKDQAGEDVAFALAEAGIPEDAADAVLEALAPTFAAMRAYAGATTPHRNGNHRSPSPGGRT